MFRNGDTKLQNFSELKKIPLREIWKNEASDFTPWLESNIETLGEALGMDLVITGREASVGDFSLDLLAEDLGSNRTVVIENQFLQTNHDHLGKLLTYAAGYDASVVIWVSEKIRDEHRQTMEWLNQRTDTDTQFFAVVVEILQIDNSNPALNFKLVVFPNEWRKSKRQKPTTNFSSKGEKYRNYYKSLIDELVKQNFTRPRTPLAQNWYNFSSGINGVNYGVQFPRGNKILAYINIGKELGEKRIAIFNALEARKTEIANNFQNSLEWNRDQEVALSTIAISRDGSIESSEGELEEIRKWHIEKLLKLKEIFQPEIERALEAIDSNDEDVGI